MSTLRRGQWLKTLEPDKPELSFGYTPLVRDCGLIIYPLWNSVSSFVPEAKAVPASVGCQRLTWDIQLKDLLPGTVTNTIIFVRAFISLAFTGRDGCQDK